MKGDKARFNGLDVTLILLLFAGGVLLRVLLLGSTGFDGLYGQDAYAYFDFAGELQSALREGRPPGSFFWPLGYPALLAVGHAILGAGPTTGQTLNALMGAALASLVYLLARQMGLGRSGALLAGLIVGVCGQALQSSIVLMADIPALFWATVSALCLWRYLADPGSKRSALLLSLSALTLTLASITRWLYLILFIPWVMTLLIVCRGRIRWRDSLMSIVAVGLILMPQLVYSSTNPNPVLNHAWVEGWSPANAFRAAFDNVDGHFEYAAINALYYAQPFYNVFYLAPVFTPFLLVGLWALVRNRHYPVLVMLLGWALLPYLFLAGIPYQNIRFPLIVVPAVALLAGIGLENVVNTSGKWLRLPLVYAALSLCVVLGISQTLTNAAHIISDFIQHQQEDKQAAGWAAERIPPGATVYTFGLTLTLKHYTSLNVHELYYETPETLSAKWTSGQDDYLFVNVWSIEHQWAGRAPQLDLHWLRDKRGLIRLGRSSYYTLYRVRG